MGNLIIFHSLPYEILIETKDSHSNSQITHMVQSAAHGAAQRQIHRKGQFPAHTRPKEHPQKHFNRLSK